MLRRVDVETEMKLNLRSSALLSTITIVGALALASCSRSGGDSVSGLDDLAYDSNANNVALIFGASNGLAGVATDVAEMDRVLSDSNYGFSFSTTSNTESTKSMILQTIREKAGEVGSKGTMALYFSGHGTQDGRFVTSSGYLGFDEVTAAIKAGRSTPLKRVIIFNDSCFSGNWVDESQTSSGSGLLSLDSPAPKGRGSEAMDAKDGDKFASNSTAAISKSMQRSNDGNEVFEQLLIMSAARDSETSLDLGSANGGAFTYSLRKVLSNLRSTKPDAKMKDMVNDTVEATDSRYHHRPQFSASPNIILEGALFGRSSPLGSSSSGGSGSGSGSGSMATPSTPSIPATPPATPSATFVSERKHFGSMLATLNAQLDACKVKLEDVVSGADGQGWYKILMTADYKSGTTAPRYYGWANLTSTPEDEATRYLKLIPTSAFSECQRKLPTSANALYAKERSHLSKTVSALNKRLAGCSVWFDKISSGADDKGVYRFLFKARYTDGTASEQRASWGQMNASADDEATAFLDAIPSRYFDQCRHKN